MRGTQNGQSLANFVWSVADLLRGDCKHHGAGGGRQGAQAERFKTVMTARHQRHVVLQAGHPGQLGVDRAVRETSSSGGSSPAGSFGGRTTPPRSRGSIWKCDPAASRRGQPIGRRGEPAVSLGADPPPVKPDVDRRPFNGRRRATRKDCGLAGRSARLPLRLRESTDRSGLLPKAASLRKNR